MSDQFRQWLTSEMEKRRFSQVELAKATGISQPFISRVLHGERLATADFCVKVALTLDEPPEKLLRLAGILPSNQTEDDTLQELMELARSLPLAKRQEVLRFVRFLYQSEQSEK
jgi:transcriptional regulator with XRE-family HTH domain